LFDGFYGLQRFQEYKFVELMSLSFAAADMETVKRTIHYRYNLVKVRSGARKEKVKFSHSFLGAVVFAADTLA